MIINTQWLLEYLEPGLSDAEALALLPRLSFEIESELAIRASLMPRRDGDRTQPGIRMGHVIEKRPHPALADHWVCRFDLGPLGTRQIVCAAEHPIELGWAVPVALEGQTLPVLGLTIHPGRFGGVDSEGMICLDRELGFLPSGTGLHVMAAPEVAPGAPLVDVLSGGPPDLRADVKVLANRPDCLGLIGLARELAAATGLKLRVPDLRLDSQVRVTDESFPVAILDPDACPRYCCRVIRGVRVGKSPMWLASRLVVVGLPTINNVVDLTNFVMLETGHPLHAFDLDQLRGGRIVVRFARGGEPFQPIAASSVPGGPAAAPELIGLSDRDLVIADAERPVALAGIKGGENSKTTEQTTDLLLESAHFVAPLIRAMRNRSRTMAGRPEPAPPIATDSSYRFERGMDPNEVLEFAAARATALIAETAGAASVGAVVDVYPKPVRPAAFEVSAGQVSDLLGYPVPPGVTRTILERLGYRAAGADRWTAPTRRIDVNDPVVIAEDVGRINGYDRVPLHPPVLATTLGVESPLNAFEDRVSQWLSDRGFFQAVTTAMDSREHLMLYATLPGSAAIDTPPDRWVTVANAMRTDLSVMRPSLVPRLVEAVRLNLNHQTPNVRLYESGRVFGGDAGAVVERWALALVATGQQAPQSWGVSRGGPAPESLGNARPVIDYFWLKGMIEQLCAHFGVMVSFEPADSVSYLHPYQQAAIRVGGARAGAIGRLSHAVEQAESIPQPTFVCQVDLDRLCAASGTAGRDGIHYPYPALKRDLNIVVDESVAYAALAETIGAAALAASPDAVRGRGISLLRHVSLLDQYRGGSIPPGKRSLTFSLAFRSPTQTLTSEDVAALEDRLRAALHDRYGAVLRGTEPGP